MMYTKPTEYFLKTLQTQEPKTCEGKKIDMTEVTLDREVNVSSKEFHLLMLFTQQSGSGPWQQRRMNKSSLSGEDCRQDTSGHQSRTRARKRNR